MKIGEEQVGPVLIVQPLEQRLDAYLAASFKVLMTDRIEKGHQRIALDLSAVDFLDSTGLGSLVHSLKLVGRQGDLVLYGVRDTVMSLFRLTRMDRVFRICQNRDEALAVLGQ